MNQAAQKRLRRPLVLMLVIASCLTATAVFAAPVDTVDWAVDPLVDGIGAGTLNAGAITVTYATNVGGGSSGFTVANNGWDVSLATDGAAGTGVTNLSAGALGTTGSQIQTIRFSSDVNSPILFINRADSTLSINFGLLLPTLLDGNNALLVANTITFPGATDTLDDGFAAVIPGTFGPGNPLQFTMLTNDTAFSFDSVAFTIANSVPEPTSFALAIVGTVGLLRLASRRKA